MLDNACIAEKYKFHLWCSLRVNKVSQSQEDDFGGKMLFNAMIYFMILNNIEKTDKQNSS